MGIERSFTAERLVIGLLRAPGLDLEPVEAALEGRFGPIDYRGKELPFEWTDYYTTEMGPGILRGFLSFAAPFDPSGLAEAKRFTDSLELAHSLEGKRRVNLDPGSLSLGRFILATTKDRAHRIPLSRGIYAELTLYFEKGSFRSLPWTYPDWKSPEYLAVLMELRARLKESHFPAKY